MSRKESKNEPSDGLRVVNALLTQIDQLKNHSNVLVLATSNLRNSIDDAFLDRADVSYEVGLPTPCTAYDILFSCIMELKAKGIISKSDTLVSFRLASQYASNSSNNGEVMYGSHLLLDIVRTMPRSSARFLRKVPFQALMKVAELPAQLPDFLAALRICCNVSQN